MPSIYAYSTTTPSTEERVFTPAWSVPVIFNRNFTGQKVERANNNRSYDKTMRWHQLLLPWVPRFLPLKSFIKNRQSQFSQKTMREKYPSTSDYRNPKLSQFATRLDPETSKCPNRNVSFLKTWVSRLQNCNPRRLPTKEFRTVSSTQPELAVRACFARAKKLDPRTGRGKDGKQQVGHGQQVPFPRMKWNKKK